MFSFFYTNISHFTRIFDGMFYGGNNKHTIKKIHIYGFKDNYFKLAEVSMVGHGCGVLQFPPFYEKIVYIYIMLPHPYVGSYEV